MKKSPRESFTVTFVKWLLATLGVILELEYKKYHTVFLIIHFGLAVVPTLITETYLLFTLDSFIEKSDVALQITSAVSVNMIILVVRQRRQAFIEIYENIVHNQFVNDAFFSASDKVLQQMLRQFGSAVIVCLILLAILPLLIAGFTDAQYGSLPTLLMPGKYPWHVNTTSEYLLTLLLQIACAVVPFLLIAGIILFTFFSRIIVNTFFLMLQNEIKSIDDEVCSHPMSVYSMNRPRRMHFVRKKVQFHNMGDDRENLVQLHKTIKYHQFLTKFANNIIYSIEPCVVVATVQFMMANICVISLVVMVDGNLLYKMKMINMMIISDIFFFLCCYMGEWLNHLNHKILDSLYEIKWYRQSIEFRETLIIFMLLLQKPLIIRMFKMANINLTLFTSVFKHTYSFIQIILKAQNKK